MDIDLMLTISTNFTSELQTAERGKKTSLPFIVQQVPKAAIVPEGDPFQVFVVGGSTGAYVQAKRVKSSITFGRVKKLSVPVFSEASVLFDFVGKYLDLDIPYVAMNFAYPLAPAFTDGVLDGILIKGTKEHRFTGLMNKQVGASISRHLSKRSAPLRVSIANDTICLLMSGLTRHSWSELAAGVVGTGLNFSFFLDADKPVNLEAAFFSNFPQSAEGKLIDRSSVERGASLFEKEVSGAYLYKHFNLIVKKEGMDAPELVSTEELNALARKKTANGAGLARLLLERSAALVACQIAGITQFKKQDMTFVMEGSLFWHAYNYGDWVEHYLRHLVPQYKISFTQVKDSDILGAAKLIA